MRQRALFGVLAFAVACAAPGPREGGPTPEPAVASTASALDTLEGPLVELPQSTKVSDFRLSPPAVVSVQAARAPSGGSLVFVTFARDQRLGRQVALSAAGNGDLILRDDGTGGDERASDGVYTGTVPLDYGALLDAVQTRLTALRRLGRTTVPVFQGRQQVADQVIDFNVNAARVSFFPFPMPWLTDPHRTLAITNLGVVEDPARTFNPCTSVGTPMGKWTFGYLMTQMANQAATGINPSDFVLDWLSRWLTNQPVGMTTFAPARPIMSTIIAAWPKLPDGRLDLAKAPFRLMAIMNRIDLAGNPSYGSVGGAELRFVFEMLDQTTCIPRSFNAILEYGVPRRNCFAMKSWAQQWLNLDALSPGSSAYNTALEAITEVVAAANAEPTKPNGSAINQVRSNEVALGLPELREFKLVATSPPAAMLREATVKQTPDAAFNGTKGGARAADLGIWIGINFSAVVAGTYTVPPVYPFGPGGDFLGASTLNNFDFWNASGIPSNQARFQLSLNTCNGCHGRETSTSFVMVTSTGFGAEATLANFLTGEIVPDPVDFSSHKFNDLLQRAGKLQAFADAFCGPPSPPPGPSFPLPPINASVLLATH